jgi:hypothetical protein
MRDLLQLWTGNPERWSTHPAAFEGGLLAAAVLALGLGVFFWIKGRYWP